MPQNKEDLDKLLLFIQELCDEKGNEWFKNELVSKFSNGKDKEGDQAQLDEIYEYCLNLILKEHAQKFYEKLKLELVKQDLISDFVRMERFRREGDFNDFCLAIHQQLECIVNFLCSNDVKFCEHIILNKETVCYKVKNVDNKLWQVILTNFKSQVDADKLFNQQLIMWEYPQKLRAVIYYYCLNKEVRNSYAFNEFYTPASELYQCRNLNHRGGFQYESQKKTTDKIKDEQHRYYFRFLGLLEKFTSTINERL